MSSSMHDQAARIVLLRYHEAKHVDLFIEWHHTDGPQHFVPSGQMYWYRQVHTTYGQQMEAIWEEFDKILDEEYVHLVCKENLK